ncbi:MAG: hypothetical protein R3E31_04175 [Chloroflexota bacterium]|nr:hypothetical protein [Ardenticatenaceae bacterium]
MGETTWQKRIIFLLLCSIIFLSTACQQETAVPTRAVAAVIPTLADNALPPTWTPQPPHAPEARMAAMATLGPSLTPSITPILPTNTPRPTVTPTPTITPIPSPSRYASYIPTLLPSSELGPSKLGLHVIRNNDFWINEFVRQGQPSVIKALDDFGYVAEIKAISPRTIVVGRFNYPVQDYAGSPEEAARKFVADQLDQYLANPAVDYWEGWNEPDPNLDNMPWYTRFEQERVRQLAQYGLRAAIGGFATGVPELDEFVLFVPAVETALEHRGILTLHEYGAPDMTFLYGSPLPGYPPYANRGALTFRYRWYYEEILKPRGLVIPLVISEAGIDGIIGNRPGPDGYGWADFQEYWVQQGWGSTGVEAFINQLAWYDNGVRQDGYVIGFTVFTAGGIGHWRNYDINAILPDLTGYVVGQQLR